MALVEYLYVDEHRLSSYIEQIRSPVKYDKVAKWTADISVTGPRATASKEVHARSLTNAESVRELVKFLRQNQLLHAQRPNAATIDVMNPLAIPFVEESCSAVRVHIPRSTRSGDTTRDLHLWLSNEFRAKSSKRPQSPTEKPATQRGLLCLLEGFRGHDQDPTNAYMTSSYTLLASLLTAEDDRVRASILGAQFDWQEADADRWHLLEAVTERLRDEMYAFAANPVQRLVELGAQVLGKRSITVLYRIRDYGPELGHRPRIGNTTSVFGYPIYIAEEATV